MDAHRLRPDLDAAALHLQLLTGEDDPTVCFQVFADSGDAVPQHRHGTLGDLAGWLAEKQREGCGVYVTVNETDGRGRRRENIVAARAAFIDLDGTPLPDRWLVEPHLVVETSPGKYHAYWRVRRTTDLTAWTDLQARLAAFFGADPSVTDPPRVARLAGFWHQKKEPFRSRIAAAEDEAFIAPLALGEMADAHPCGYQPPAERGDGGRSDVPAAGWDTAEAIARAADWLSRAEPAVEDHGGDRRTYATACVLRDLGISEDKALDLMSGAWNERCDPPWDHDDLALKVRNAYRYAAGDAGSNSPEADFEGAPDIPRDEPDPPGTVAGITYTLARDVEQRPVRWLWPSRFAVGKMGILAGFPDTGKTNIACDIAARVSAGLAWPDGSGRAERGRVLFLSAEDDAADTLAPRLQAAGADLSNVAFVGMTVSTGDGGRRMLNLGEDLERMSRLVEALGGVRLLVVDPISAYLGGKIDGHRNTEVRAVLAPISDWAERHGAAVVCITHFNKGGTGRALYRITDSLAFTASARTAWVVVEERDEAACETGRKLMLKGKNNLAGDPGGMAYTIEGTDLGGGISTSRISWDGAVHITADEAMEAAQTRRDSPALDAAQTFLDDLLAFGPVAQQDVERLAEAEGHSASAVRRAKKALRVQSNKRAGRGWEWSLPT